MLVAGYFTSQPKIVQSYHSTRESNGSAKVPSFVVLKLVYESSKRLKGEWFWQRNWWEEVPCMLEFETPIYTQKDGLQLNCSMKVKYETKSVAFHPPPHSHFYSLSHFFLFIHFFFSHFLLFHLHSLTSLSPIHSYLPLYFFTPSDHTLPEHAVPSPPHLSSA